MCLKLGCLSLSLNCILCFIMAYLSSIVSMKISRDGEEMLFLRTSVYVRMHLAWPRILKRPTIPEAVTFSPPMSRPELPTSITPQSCAMGSLQGSGTWAGAGCWELVGFNDL